MVTKYLVYLKLPKEPESGLRKNMIIKFVDTDREEFKFVISEYEGWFLHL